MAVSTQLKSTEKYPVHFHEEVCNFSMYPTMSFLYEQAVQPGRDEDILTHDFISDDKKIFMSLDISVYHLLHDYLGLILYHHEQYPDATFVFDISRLMDFWHQDGYDMVSFIFKALNDHGIKVKVLDINQRTVINANNFYTFETYNETYRAEAPRRVFEFFKKYIEHPDLEPYRKVYISRKFNTSTVSHQDEMPGWDVFNDNRMDNHEMVEKFFADQGYEIVYAEKFPTFIEQLNFFYSVKTLASITGSGLVNSMFMKPGQNVIELVTPLQLVLFRPGVGGLQDGPISKDMVHKRAWLEEFHHFYSILSIKKNHTYVGINNMTRKASEVVEQLASYFSNISNNSDFKSVRQ